jgi:glycosyltransferase involved in cell wall biosynthesis
MRLAIISDAIYPYHKGGKETRLYEVSTRLSRAGFNVHVYTMKWWDGPEKMRYEDGVWLHAISRRWPLYHGARRSIVQGVMFGLACFKLLFEQFDVADVDHMPYFPLFSMRVVCSLKRKPMVATWHEVWGLEYWRNYLGPAGRLAAGLERLTVSMPDAIVAVSEQTARELTVTLKAKRPVSLAPNGVDVTAIAEIAPANEVNDIVYVGRLLKHKRIDDLIHAVALLQVKQPSVRCLIIGDGPERGRLTSLARELGVAGNVRFTGIVVRDEDKLKLMKSAKVFVLPSVREGFSFVTLEALACGLPVVTVDHPGNAARHLVTPGAGRVVTACDAVALAGGIKETLTQAGFDVAGAARPYDWQHATRTLTEVYGR